MMRVLSFASMIARFLFLLFLLCSGAWAQTPLVLDAGIGTGMLSFSGRLAWLKDDARSMTQETAYAATDWQVLAGEPGFGFTHSAIWLRLAVTQPEGASSSWRLEVNNPLLEDVRFYLRDVHGEWREQRAGRLVPHADWPLDTRTPLFIVDLPPGTHQAMLRLSTRNSLSAAVRLWTPEAWHRHERDEAMLWGAYFGIYGLVILIQFLFWKWTRESLSGWYVPYAAGNFLAIMMTMGHLQGALGMGADMSSMLLGLLICASLGVACKFSSVQLELACVMPLFNRWLIWVGAALSVVTGLLVLAGEYALGVGIAQVMSLTIVTVMFGVAIKWLRRGHRPAAFFLVAFGIFYIGILIRYLRNLGFIEPVMFTDYSVQIGSLLQMLVMCLFVVYRYNTLKIALQIEQTARREQREFVAMVSHEYRTPLAIISTSAQQLAANLDAPREKSLKRCANIRDATRRMGDLLDKYLSAERLDEANQSLHLTAVDPQELLEDVVAEWPGGRIGLMLDNMPAKIVCDRALCEVALRNLLANADRHASHDTVVEVAATADGKGGLRVTVANAGDVIPPDEQPRLFEKYFRGRAARDKPGAGLGLYLVRRIVELHGGKVDVASITGRTAFSIVLPRIA